MAKRVSTSLAVLCLAVGVWLVGPLLADWSPGDGHKMHFPQLPDEAGWDVNATQPLVLADDWQCSETGWVKDVHFWGSWKHGIEGQIQSFVLSIHEDIPADQSPTGYSMPGATLWEEEITEFVAVPIDPPSMEGWYDPASGEVIFDDHQAYFQYNVFLPEELWFWQEAGTIYWLNISAILEDPVNTKWGWKSTLDHWNDDAVWANWGNLAWTEMWQPERPLHDEFWVTVDQAGNVIDGGGTDPYGQGWYEYFSGWWNIWFYDHPYDPERKKEFHIEFDVFKLDPSQPSNVQVAINWSSDVWSEEGNTDPPLPDVVGVNEDLYIGRHQVFFGDNAEGHYAFDFELPVYNPEWVSVDVQGYNFVIPEGGLNFIDHACIGSLDLSFVITGGEPPQDTCDFYKLPYPDYSPQGMPDFDMKQDASWVNPQTLAWSWDGPCALANCIWWFDSKFEPNPVDPRPFQPSAASPPPNDGYPLLSAYAGPGTYDDHDTLNVPPFVTDLAMTYLNTDSPHWGTLIPDMQLGFRSYLANVGLSGHFQDTLVSGPTYEYIRDQVLESQDVILLISFFEDAGADPVSWIGSHYVTVAGVCTDPQLRQICVSDPWLDALEGEPPAGSAHGPTLHNDADNISGPHSQIQHDPYQCQVMTLPGMTGPVEVINYPYNANILGNFLGMNRGTDYAAWSGGVVYPVIEAALVICPDTVDKVECEPQGGTNPTHPPSYWYDVTPGGGTGRCDFHVRTHDSIAGNYSNWVEPAGWTHAVHKVGTDWYVSWWDPTCTNAIFGTFRFQFDNASPDVWDRWVTTNSGTSNPTVGVIDSAENHTTEPNGYGYLVHVPRLEDVQPPDTCEFYKAPWEDYAPNGMPDFDMKQAGWLYGTTQWSHSGPVALANCYWWFDSKYEPNPIDPRPFQPSAVSPPANDGYPLVRSYDPAGVWDDHDTLNVIPFVDSLAVYSLVNTMVGGTYFMDLYAGATVWLSINGLLNYYDVKDYFGEDIDFAFISEEVRRSEDLILLLGFWEETPTGCQRVGGHYVTVAGVCDQTQSICISDPYLDANEGEPPAGSAHAPGVHNDAFNVSGPHGTIHHDKYPLLAPPWPCGIPAYWQLPTYPINSVNIFDFEGMNEGPHPSAAYQGGTLYTVIEWVLDISPCCNLRGDVNNDGSVNVADLTYLVDFLFRGGPPPPCMPEADINGDGAVNVADLTALVDFLFRGGPPPVPCP